MAYAKLCLVQFCTCTILYLYFILYLYSFLFRLPAKVQTVWCSGFAYHDSAMSL